MSSMELRRNLEKTKVTSDKLEIFKKPVIIQIHKNI